MEDKINHFVDWTILREKAAEKKGERRRDTDLTFRGRTYPCVRAAALAVLGFWCNGQRLNEEEWMGEIPNILQFLCGAAPSSSMGVVAKELRDNGETVVREFLDSQAQK